MTAYNKFGGGDRGDRGGDRGGYRGNGGFGGGGRSFGGRSDGPKQMFPAVCGKCGEDCQVPFRPSGDRPVFCSNCFKEQGGGNDRPQFAPKSFGGGRDRDMGARVSNSPDYSAQFASLNVKLDKILSIIAPVKVEKVAKVETYSNASVQKEEVVKEKKVAKKAKSKKK